MSWERLNGLFYKRIVSIMLNYKDFVEVLIAFILKIYVNICMLDIGTTLEGTSHPSLGTTAPFRMPLQDRHKPAPSKPDISGCKF